MLATPTDPLLTSPQRAMRINDDMAVLQVLGSLSPSSSSSSSSSENDDDAAVAVVGVVGSSSSSSNNNNDADKDASNESTLAENSKGNEAEEEEEPPEPFFQLMNRGNYLRQLRMLAEADEMERSSLPEEDEMQGAYGAIGSCVGGVIVGGEEKKEECSHDVATNTTATAINNNKASCQAQEVQQISNKHRLLSYPTYLSHQRYHDDLKHVDMHYIDYGVIPSALLTGEAMEDNGGKLIVEQRKRLGKGGLCWDAAFVLGEHVIAVEEEWNAKSASKADEESNGDDGECFSKKTTVLELGAGTGLCGLMIAKATNSHVTITDLPELEGLMLDNVLRNFGSGGDAEAEVERDLDLPSLTTHDGKAKGTVTSRVLRWGVEEDYGGAPFDVIVGADIVASLNGPNTKIYISSKARLDKPHQEFDAEIDRLFESVKRVKEPKSRLKSPNVFLIVAEGKKRAV
ncbi:predicted protein [Thalassiosira pseudonana CCMP1335]|uniref:Uncharacterized protein n=1 Tax=Thalassiosira pseudonana TaxID=35128 RepID=B8CFI6_THAPS|nr:predicted protein [Thalassiosira pseudonana CCMP1335]EED87809.1 predicted protein [Thalassiosira pseudonana CCMP1335]